MAMKSKPARSRTPTIPLLLIISAISVLYILCTSSSSSRSSQLVPKTLINPGIHKSGADGNEVVDEKKYLYWGSRIDCPGKHCNTCAGLGHQESSLRCALEEAMYLQRTFVMPSRMCINPMHNKKGILRQSDNENSDATWATSSCAMDSLYDLSLMSETVPVILDNSKTWYEVVSTSMKLEDRGVAHVKDVHREDLKHNDRFAKLLLINRTASPLSCSWVLKRLSQCKEIGLKCISITNNTVTWRGHGEGFVVKDTYNTIIEHISKVEWYKLVWNDFNSPRDSFNVWLVVQNKMMTRDRMSQWGYMGDNTCVLCGILKESRDHLHFECSFSYDVWNKVLRFLQVVPPDCRW